MQVQTIGLDIAKSVFQVHGVDAPGETADAEAICEAVTRPNIRFVAVKTRDEQALSLLHAARSQLVSQRTANALFDADLLPRLAERSQLPLWKKFAEDRLRSVQRLCKKHRLLGLK